MNAVTPCIFIIIVLFIIKVLIEVPDIKVTVVQFMKLLLFILIIAKELYAKKVVEEIKAHFTEDKLNVDPTEKIFPFLLITIF